MAKKKIPRIIKRTYLGKVDATDYVKKQVVLLMQEKESLHKV